MVYGIVLRTKEDVPRKAHSIALPRRICSYLQSHSGPGKPFIGCLQM